MGTLRLFSPDSVVDLADDSDVAILPLRRPTLRPRSTDQLRILNRARMRFANRICPCCCRATVAPVELKDCEYDRGGREIPGTATVVGFSCERCGHEWPAHRPEAV